MSISEDLRKSARGADSPELERGRTRRTLMLHWLGSKRFGKETGRVIEWLFNLATHNRDVMADVFDGKVRPRRTEEDEQNYKYIENHLEDFRWLYEYVLYGSPDVERSLTQEEYDMTIKWFEEHERDLLNKCLTKVGTLGRVSYRL